MNSIASTDEHLTTLQLRQPAAAQFATQGEATERTGYTLAGEDVAPRTTPLYAVL